MTTALQSLDRKTWQGWCSARICFSLDQVAYNKRGNRHGIPEMPAVYDQINASFLRGVITPRVVSYDPEASIEIDPDDQRLHTRIRQRIRAFIEEFSDIGTSFGHHIIEARQLPESIAGRVPALCDVVHAAQFCQAYCRERQKKKNKRVQK